MPAFLKPVVAIAAVLLLSPVGQFSYADEPAPASIAAATLGFTGHFEQDRGMIVDRVHYGTPAWRLGLERGDVLQSINGDRIRSAKHFAELLHGSPYRVRLTVVDVRTGRPASRSAILRAPYEPEEIEAFANR